MLSSLVIVLFIKWLKKKKEIPNMAKCNFCHKIILPQEAFIEMGKTGTDWTVPVCSNPACLQRGKDLNFVEARDLS